MFFASLERSNVGLKYMLVGSYSSNIYGRERATNDADFVVVIDPTQLTEVARLLGSDLRVESQMSFETITMTTRYIVHHPATAFKIELFLLSEDPHDKTRFERRQLVDFEGHPTSLPTRACSDHQAPMVQRWVPQ